MNCSSRIYHHNNLGFTRHCTCQDAIHLTFGNVSVLLSKSQLREFTAYIAQTLHDNSDQTDRDHKCIYLPTRDQYLMFVLSYNEIIQLADILDNTHMMLAVEDALNSTIN